MRSGMSFLHAICSWRLCVTSAVLWLAFVLSLWRIRFHAEGEPWYNFGVDWLRFGLFLAAAVSAAAWAYRGWFGKTPQRQKMFLSLASAMVILLLMELMLRLATPRYYWYGTRLPKDAAAAFEPDPILGWRGVPDSRANNYSFEFTIRLRHNSSGYRDRDLPTSASAQPRVLFCGDSYTWGWGVDVEGRFDRLVQKRLAQNGIGIETVNASLPGYGTDQEYLVFQRLAPVVCPDVVVLQFCENDVEYNNLDQVETVYKNNFTVDESGQLVQHSDHHGLLPPKKVPLPRWIKTANEMSLPILGFSHVYRWCYSKVSHSLWLDRLVLGPKAKAALPEAPNDPDEWKVTLALMKAMDRQCREMGARMILLIVPERHTIRWKSSLFYRETLTAFCRRQDIPCVDLEANGPFNFDRNCYVMDPHWNRRGHETAARALAPVIEEYLRQRASGKPVESGGARPYHAPSWAE